MRNFPITVKSHLDMFMILADNWRMKFYEVKHGYHMMLTLHKPNSVVYIEGLHKHLQRTSNFGLTRQNVYSLYLTESLGCWLRWLRMEMFDYNLEEMVLQNNDTPAHSKEIKRLWLCLEGINYNRSWWDSCWNMPTCQAFISNVWIPHNHWLHSIHTCQSKYPSHLQLIIGCVCAAQ